MPPPGIRETSEAEYWDELRRTWGALLSDRYIGASFSSMNTTAVDPTVRIRHDMRNPAVGTPGWRSIPLGARDGERQRTEQTERAGRQLRGRDGAVGANP